MQILLEGIKNHPVLGTMFVQMQQPWFHLETEAFEYRSRHFPWFMHELYRTNLELPDEFAQYTDNEMLLTLVHDFVREEKLRGVVNEVIETPEKYPRDHLLLCFKLFSKIEEKLIADIAAKKGLVLTKPATLVYDKNGELDVVTADDLKDKKATDSLNTFNEFAAGNVKDTRLLLKRKGEMETIDFLRERGFAIKDVGPAADETLHGMTAIRALNTATDTHISMYVDEDGVPAYITDLEGTGHEVVSLPSSSPSPLDSTQILRTIDKTNWRQDVSINVLKSYQISEVIEQRATEDAVTRGQEKPDVVNIPFSRQAQFTKDTGNHAIAGEAVEPQKKEINVTQRVPFKRGKTTHAKPAETVPYIEAEEMKQKAPIIQDVLKGGMGSMRATEHVLEERGGQRKEQTAMKERPNDKSRKAKMEKLARARSPKGNVNVHNAKKHHSTFAESALKGTAIATALGTTGILATSFFFV